MARIQSTLLGLLAFTIPTIHALRTVQGSPCTSLCGDTSNTTSSEISCIDSAYNTTQTGETFESCVSCLLESNFQNATSGETDVNWGLYNLRFAFTSCVYDYPVPVTNVSTPCLVSCTTLGPALEMQLTDPVGSDLSSFCNSTFFADNVVTTCENCYTLTTEQAYLTNFLEAVRYNCHFPNDPGVAYSITPDRIFNDTELPSTTNSYGATTSATSTGESNVKKYLTVIIVMPIIGFLAISALTALCCFCLIQRRRRLAEERRSNQRNRWATGTFTAAWQPAWTNYPGSPYQQQFAMESTAPFGSAPFGSAIPGKGFNVVESDGKTYEAGYSTQYVTPVSEDGSDMKQSFQFRNESTSTQGQDIKHAESYQEFFASPGAPHAL
ncbi:hypothetical protein UA08_08224 [Talaromyces atroroseus]|uniref:Uncharacterized protein n=1 Tax=Talaromyces atroroseus TaxID=1441469 RepID=A0A225ANC0_TALAT|nr:hypothetical protein UA08_08224 [Talaromyces atroroseus]OKL56446.1 hypothetical protein UA08_08224 [Talaromyces atroroseus]